MTKKKTNSTTRTNRANEDAKPAKRLRSRKEQLAPAVETPVNELKVTAAATPTTGPSKLSALDAAAKVLAEAGKPLSTKEMIGAMAAKGYWTSPGGKTPHATLYSAILREVTAKGEKSRFRKAGPGRFALNAKAA